jgi:tetratricopeptide (TPR) repeat protein
LARLGRCQWLIGKGGDDPDENVRKAEASFERALELNPELPLALNLHALLEIDQGRAPDAMVRLVARARAGSSQPELYAALVQACRFCGLLEASVAAHERAHQLDRHILTSVDHTWWHLREYDRALEYVTRRHYGEVSITNRAMRGVILGERGRTSEALLELREVEQAKLTEFFRDLVCMYRALHEEQREVSLAAAGRLLAGALDAETLWQVARVLAYFGERARALAAFNLSLERGFIVYRILTRVDPWLDALRDRSILRPDERAARWAAWSRSATLAETPARRRVRPTCLTRPAAWQSRLSCAMTRIGSSVLVPAARAADQQRRDGRRDARSMKRSERHHLKENEFAEWLLGAKNWYEANNKTVGYIGIAAALTLVAVMGTLAFRQMNAAKANSALAEALTVAEAPVLPPRAGSGKPPVQRPGTFPTIAPARAALPKLMAVAEAYPEATRASWRATAPASALVAIGRTQEGYSATRKSWRRAGSLPDHGRLGIARPR